MGRWGASQFLKSLLPEVSLRPCCSSGVGGVTMAATVPISQMGLPRLGEGRSRGLEVFLWPHRAPTPIPEPDTVCVTTCASEGFPGSLIRAQSWRVCGFQMP